MPQQIVECIPNFSEGRRPEVIAAIVAAIQTVPGTTLLDRSSDADHNRSVVTFVGTLEAVEEAAFQGIAKAVELIDMAKHKGEHPRMGAADVVPFVPISGVAIQDCVLLARRLGERVGTQLGIPVYLYEEAATKPWKMRRPGIYSWRISTASKCWNGACSMPIWGAKGHPAQMRFWKPWLRLRPRPAGARLPRMPGHSPRPWSLWSAGSRWAKKSMPQWKA